MSGGGGSVRSGGGGGSVRVRSGGGDKERGRSSTASQQTHHMGMCGRPVRPYTVEPFQIMIDNFFGMKHFSPDIEAIDS